MRQLEELRYAILALQREGNRALASSLRPFGVTPAQAEVVRVLEDRAPLTLAGLGELLLCESGTGPSRLVDRLVHSGHVERSVASTDRRAVTLTLSDSGHELAGRIALVEKEMYDLLESLSTGHDVEATLALLRSMLAPFPAGAALERRANL
jgi:DNA-binding MarR family transcriptional regulator